PAGGARGLLLEAAYRRDLGQEHAADRERALDRRKEPRLSVVEAAHEVVVTGRQTFSLEIADHRLELEAFVARCLACERETDRRDVDRRDLEATPRHRDGQAARARGDVERTAPARQLVIELGDPVRHRARKVALRGPAL